jgi:hypothetical protein
MAEPAAAPKAVATGICPIDLATLKDDLGIDEADTSSDAWLQRRMDGIWAHFEQITSRSLQLATDYADDWGEIAQNQVPWMRQPMNVPPSQAYMPMTPRPFGYATVFLTQYPVSSISKITFWNDQQDASLVIFAGDTGKLMSVQGPGFATDLSSFLLSARVRVEYVAGFDTIPADLYEALLGVMAMQWANRQALSGGLLVGGFMPKRVSAIDVGQIDIDRSPSWLVDQATAAGKVADPLIGIYASVLDSYTDYRTAVGSAVYPTSVKL